MPKNILRKIKSSVNKIRHSKIKFTDDIKKGVMKSDCVMTDVWVSMGEKSIKKKSFFKNYQVNNNVMKLAKKNSIFMHCLPAHSGEEVSNNVIDGHQSIVWQQAKNRIYVQQAILSYIFNKK